MSSEKHRSNFPLKSRLESRWSAAHKSVIAVTTFWSLTAYALPACDIASFKTSTDTTLLSARSFTTPVNYCRLDGYVTTQNPGPNRVNFMVALPEKNNGRYVFTIQGGAAAFVPDPTDAHLRAGYAIASTDKGVRAANGFDFSFRNDPAQTLDWGHRGVHVTALATQDLTRQYYDKKHFYRYAMGCSGGGDGTLSAAENHPTDFDGFIAAAMTTAPLEVTTLWGMITQHIAKDPSAWLSREELAKVEQTILAKYDGSDGAIDGLIWEPTKIQLLREDFAFLNDAQFKSLQLLQAGIHLDEDAYYPGYWLGNPTGFAAFTFGFKRPPWAPNDLPPTVPAGWLVADSSSKAMRTPTFSLITDFDFEDAQQLKADRAMAVAKGRETFDPQDLKPLQAGGGKIILWSGSSDQSVPPQNILDYTTKADQVFGTKKRSQFIRTFLIPGMFHCSGGVNQPTDVPTVMLEKAAAWVEKNTAPDTVVASSGGTAPDVIVAMNTAPGQKVYHPESLGTARTYLLCPWPQHSIFKGGIDNPGKLDVNVAANWQCQ